MVSPLLEARAVDWQPPEGAFDALLLTSASAARLAGTGAERFRALPVYAVGEATAVAARAVGFGDVCAGDDDATALLVKVAAAGHRRVLHLAGRDRMDMPETAAERVVRVVYAAELADLTPEARAALAGGAIDWVLLFSARSAHRFAELWPQHSDLSVAAISPTALAAAGPGWARAVAADEPTEAGVLAAAGLTCDKAA